MRAAFNPAVSSARSAAPLAPPTLKHIFAHMHSPSPSCSRASSNSAAVPANMTHAKSHRASLALPRLPPPSQGFAMIAGPSQPRTPRLLSAPTLPPVFTPPPAPTPMSTPVTPGTGPSESYFLYAGAVPSQGFASTVQMRTTIIKGPSSVQNRGRHADARALRLPVLASQPSQTVTSFPMPTAAGRPNMQMRLAHSLPHAPGARPGSVERIGLGLTGLGLDGGNAVTTIAETPRVDEDTLEETEQSHAWAGLEMCAPTPFGVSYGANSSLSA
ncbi:hypothetical protein DFH11DRAFT_1725148 [Phellopilus nigrolimitatus]|nr:hypothetical protein DFH11DRAFT_1725148 [Phellopilus nigrolimitatus]